MLRLHTAEHTSLFATQILVHTVDTARYSFLLETCLEVDRPVLFTGASGVGKSAIIHDTLNRLQAAGAEAKGAVDGPRHYMPVVSSVTGGIFFVLFLSNKSFCILMSLNNIRVTPATACILTYMTATT